MRKEELTETINTALAFAMSNLHTTVVCKVLEVGGKTISCQPVINRIVDDESKELPVFTEVPPIFMNGGSSYTAHPISVGDYCLVFISERCYDAWFYGDDFVNPIERRMHDYSDGFALVGIKNNSGAIEIPDVITQIGDMYARGNWEHIGDLDRTGNEIVTGDRTQTGNVDLTGNESVTGLIDASVKISAPILSGVLTGVGGADPIIPQSVTATELHANNGATGSFISLNGKTITVVNGIITGIA